MTQDFKLTVDKAIIFIAGLFLAACTPAHLETTPEIVSANMMSYSTPLPTPPSFDLSQIQWIYVGKPLDMKSGQSFGSSKLSVFYKNGDFGRMYVGLDEGKAVDKLELRAYFDEVVQYGKWQERNDEIVITIQKCRCDHCLEDRPSDNSAKNPLPQTEKWKKENATNDGSVLTKSGKKMRLVLPNDFVFMNYDEMVAEPFKIKDYKEDRFCTALDLRNFEKY